MRYLTAILSVAAIAAMSVPALAQVIAPALTSSAPAEIVVSSTPTTLDIYGDGFENEGHPDRDQYMHFQVRRDDSAWQRCVGMVENGVPAAHDCGLTGWTTNDEVMRLGSFFSARPGFVEVRVWHALGLDSVTDPVAGSGGWSNVLRIPIVLRPKMAMKLVPTPAPTPIMKALPGDMGRVGMTVPVSSVIIAKTTCPSTYVYQKAGDALVENGSPVVLQRGTDVRVMAKPTGMWAAIVHGEHQPPAYVRVSCLSSLS